MRVTIGNFGGLIPRRSAHNLSAIQASIAHDVKLRNGRLEPWRETCPFAEARPTSISFHIHGCCPVFWDDPVIAAEVAPDWGRFYITGRTDHPEAVVLDCKCQPTYTALGVPAPVAPPRATGDESCGRDSDARAYVYTYVNKWGEESAPSPASNILTMADGVVVRVTNIALPPDGYDITHANIYRATTGFREANVQQQKPLTDYLYVTTITFPTTTFTDNIKMAYLSTALDTQKVRMPPAGLTNIVSIEGVVRLAGTTKNRIHMTENFQLHNWPVKYDLTLDSTIIHMGCLDQKLYVTTDTTPYVIDVSSCEDMKCTPVLDIGIALPDIACKYSSSALMTQHGYIYSSPLGLVLIDPTAKHHILTAKWFSEDDWAQIQPDTIRMAYWEGFLFFMTDAPGASFVLNIDTQPYGDMPGSELVTISDKPVDLRIDSVGKLFMLQDGIISVWNTGAQYREFIWKSRELTGGAHQPNDNVPSAAPPLGHTWSPASAKIRTTDTEFTLSSPLQEVAYQRKVINEEPFRLPRVGRHMWFKVQLKGRAPVEFVDLGTAHFTVNSGA